ncbi:DUF3427 domain-containing protein [Citricoccus sp. NR2]|uniref:DUF3427 domain-containing protein n=1 Tax=Citricoccus sp. NR2 TaxID=3004095 RepID=UPI0022DE20EC|nr:DEAD/DEAH box helicase [Citricoccus sp. NR2]WBL20125.1 DUF3427 domain-containing protein [Citricoccus sp. NR2]
MEFYPGVYESLLTRRLRAAIDQAHWETAQAKVPEGEDALTLGRHLGTLIDRALVSLKEPEDRLALAHRIIGLLGEDFEVDVPDDSDGLQELTQVAPTTVVHALPRPQTPFTQAALITNARDEPSLGSELSAELASADRVDLLCAFVKWHGLTTLAEPLRELARRKIPFRVITTTYIGATERQALERIVREFGGEVKVNYETNSTRLHAKAWLFHRESGFSTAYVGSSNLSKSALLDGLEWNVRLSAISTPELLRKFEATFATYWADPGFERFDPDTDSERLDRALGRSAARQSGTTIDVSGLEVRPYPHQTIMLEDLAAERSIHDRHRNLLVAATGTGKTVIAALDYRNLEVDLGHRPRLLFVAHRQEILAQARRTYREVLADGGFGELLVDGQVPQRWDHVFASVQSLSAERLEALARDRFDVIVIDEFHHASAATYRRLLEHLEPRELLGLTATPERADGLNVRELFGGRIASELRLWDALEADILVPFHYFGIADTVQLDRVGWRHGTYDVSELSTLYTGDDARVRLVVRELQDKVGDLSAMRALGFCVSVDHAMFMSHRFNEAGIPSAVVVGETTSADRRQALDDLRSGSIQCIFAVDVFNEGLDVPEVNTVLFLRPTQSATIFLQQLGRGLRRTHGKSVLSVLDFVGAQRREFRFDQKLRALTGSGRSALLKDIENGFPFLPAGSRIVLDDVSTERILENVRAQLNLNANQLAQDIREHAGDRNIWEYRLKTYLDEAGRTLRDVYGGSTSNRRSWTSLRAKAEPQGAPRAEALKESEDAWKLLHVDDRERAEAYRSLLMDMTPYEQLQPRSQDYARMLYFTIAGQKHSRMGLTGFSDGLQWLRSRTAFVAEAGEVLEYAMDRAHTVPRPTGLGGRIPLLSHVRYRREEILAALAISSWDRAFQSHVEGVAFSETFQTDALLINLKKSERDFSPATMYRDYAISPTEFHWESQGKTRRDSETGQRYLTKNSNGTSTLLFVRHSKNDEIGTEPFLCLGTADLVSATGERPIQIVWKLDRPMPADWFRAANAVA